MAINPNNIKKLLQVFTKKNTAQIISMMGKLNPIIKTLNGVLGTLKGITNALSGAVETWRKFDDAAVKTTRSLGLAKEQANQFRKSLIEQQVQLGVLFDVGLEELEKFQATLTEVTGRVQLLSKVDTKQWAALSKLVPSEAIKEMANQMDRMGGSIQVSNAYLALTRKQAQKFGLDVNQATSTFAKNMKLANAYGFKNGISGIQKMTMLSQQLKVDMNSIAKASEKFSTIGGAIETSANLQLLGGEFGAQFSNPMDAMADAMFNQEGFMDRIVNTMSAKATFDKQTGIATINNWLDRAKIKEAANQLGISAEELTNMATRQATNAEIEKSLNNKNAFSESELTAIKNMAQFDASNQRFVINTADGQSHDISNMTPEELAALMPHIATDDIDLNVKNIAANVDRLVQGTFDDAASMKSLDETLSGAKKSIDAMEAYAIDKPMEYISTKLTEIGNDIGNTWDLLKWSIPLISAKTALGGIAGLVSGLIGGASEGGMVQNGPETGDNTVIRVNKGEMVLTKQQQASLFNLANGKPSRDLQVKSGYHKTIGKDGIARYFKDGQRGSVKAQEALVQSSKTQNSLFRRLISRQESVFNKFGKNVDVFGRTSDKISHLKEGITARQRLTRRVVNKNIGRATSVTKKVYDGSKVLGRKALTKGAQAIGKNLIKSSSTKLPIIGTLLAAGYGIHDSIKANDTMRKKQFEIAERKDLTSKQKQQLYRETENERNGTYGKAIGATLGTAIGTAFGGILGGAAGNWLGGKIGNFIGKNANNVKDFMFGKKNVLTDEEQKQQVYEETKIGQTSLNDPQLMEKANYATVKMHDLLVSIWHHMNGKDSNGEKSSNGLMGNIGKVIGGTITAPWKILGGALGAVSNAFNTTNETVQRNNNVYTNNWLERSRQMQVMESSMMKNQNVEPKTVVGAYTPILPKYDIQQPTVQPIKDINLNINGTLKLDGSSLGNRKIDIDLSALLDEPKFKRKIIEMVTEEFTKVNGKQVKDSKMYKTNGQGYAVYR